MIRIIFPILGAAVLALSTPLAAQAPAALAPDAPDRYTVVRGDTLWDISGRFLREPWRWPEVWRMNRSEINNPHLIYPGQVVFLDRSGPYLSIGRPVGAGGSERLSPRVYEEALEAAITSIPIQAIEPFLNRTLVVDEEGLEQAGTVIATDNQRVFMATGDTVFARNIPTDAEVVHIFRPARPLVDPETGETLAHEADYLGSARVEARGRPADTEQQTGWNYPHPSEADAGSDPFYGKQNEERAMGTPATLRIIEAVEEIGNGDRIVRVDRPSVFAYVPRAPERDIEGRLVSIYRGVYETGAGNVVTLGVGARDGLEPGHVLALHRPRGEARYREGQVTEVYELPQQRYGVVFVFRVFDNVSHALVMDTDGQVTVGDVVRRP